MKLIHSILLILIVTFFSFSEISACSCIEIEIDEALNSAHSVFTGEVLGMYPILSISDTSHYYQLRRKVIAKKGNLDTLQLAPKDQTFNNYFAFRITRVFKGESLESDTVLISASSPYFHSSCDMYFSPGNKYIIYAYTGDYTSTSSYHTTNRTAIPYKMFTTGMCTRTQVENEKEIAGIEKIVKSQQTFWETIRKFFKYIF